MRSFLSILVLFIWLATCPAAAYVDFVALPETAELGQTIDLMILGGMPDSCWELLDVQVSYQDLTATVDVATRDGEVPGVACLTVIIPYELHPQLLFDRPGEWEVRVVETATHTDGSTSEFVWEGEIVVTGETDHENSTWENIKAIYR
jgi:hypothetical protein